MADEVSTTVKSIVEKVLEADVTDRIARRGRELAAVVGEATDSVSARATDAWRETAPTRKDAQKTVRKASRQAMGWSRRTWKRDINPTLRDLWKRRTVAIGAAGAAIPAGRELVEDAATRMGIRRRHEARHWTAFFIGLLIGAAAGAIVALLTAPKRGSEMRDELAGKARDAAEKAREGAGDWVPLFQRPDENGETIPLESTTGTSAETPLDATPLDATPIEGEDPRQGI